LRTRPLLPAECSVDFGTLHLDAGIPCQGKLERIGQRQGLGKDDGRHRRECH
jgi:hypothetical protein